LCTPDEAFAPRTSARLRLSGTVVAVQNDPVAPVVTICIGNTLTRALLSPEEAASLTAGDSVVVAVKAFSPIVIKAGGASSHKAAGGN
jgi:hypothetical protein